MKHHDSNPLAPRSMSIFAVSILPQRALVATDSACVWGDSPWDGRETAKMYLLPQWNFVMCGLGSVALQRRVFRRLLDSDNTLDRVDPGMRAMLDDTHSVMMEDPDTDSRRALELPNSIFLVGWSDAHEAVTAFAYRRDGNAQFFRRYIHTAGFYAAPWDFTRRGHRDPETVSEMAEAAHDAIQCGLDADPKGCFGGRVVIADVRQNSISTLVLPGPARALEKSADAALRG